MSPPEDKTPNAAVLRACAMVELLAGQLPDGLSNKALAQALGCSPSTACRTADVLVAQGWVQRLPSGNYCASVRFTRLITRVLSAFVEADRRLQEQRANHLQGASADALAWLRERAHVHERPPVLTPPAP